MVDQRAYVPFSAGCRRRPVAGRVLYGVLPKLNAAAVRRLERHTLPLVRYSSFSGLDHSVHRSAAVRPACPCADKASDNEFMAIRRIRERQPTVMDMVDGVL